MSGTDPHSAHSGLCELPGVCVCVCTASVLMEKLGGRRNRGGQDGPRLTPPPPPPPHSLSAPEPNRWDPKQQVMGEQPHHAPPNRGGPLLSPWPGVGVELRGKNSHPTPVSICPISGVSVPLRHVHEPTTTTTGSAAPRPPPPRCHRVPPPLGALHSPAGMLGPGSGPAAMGAAEL